MSSCRRVAPLLDAFVDGEMPPEKILEVEQHLSGCQTCMEQVRFSTAVRRSLRRAVRREASPSEAFRQRVAAAMAAETRRERAAVRRRRRAPVGVPWTSAGPLAAAAAAAALWAGNVSRSEPQPAESTPAETKTQAAGGGLTLEHLLDELVDYHTMPPVPQITEPNLVRQLEPEVGVPVKLPGLTVYGATWQGGSVIPVRKERAAVFRYQLSGHPVTVYVYNASRVPLRAVLEPRVVQNMPVHVGAHRGYSIAALEQRGVGYAIATDLDDAESAELVVASMH